LDDALAEGAVIRSGRNGGAPRGWGSEGGAGHSQGTEYFALAETVQAFVSDTLQQDAENDKADVAVFGLRARICCQRGGERGCEQVFSRGCLQKQLLVGGQAGGVREDNADGDVPAAGITPSELGHDGDHWSIEVKQSAFVKDHGHAGRGDDLGDRCQIEDAGGGGGVRIGLESEAAEGAQGDQSPTISDRDRGGGKCFLVDCLLDYIKSLVENVLLPLISRSREAGCGLSAGLQRRRAF